jgi:hypothetical protein
MAPPYRDARDFFSAVAEMAEELRQAIVHMTEAERSELVTKLVQESDMVVGVWPDAEAGDGVGIAVIKGEDVMPPLVGFETEREVNIAAIPCVDRHAAVAAREALRADDPPQALSASTALSISEVARLGWVATRRLDSVS